MNDITPLNAPAAPPPPLYPGDPAPWFHTAADNTARFEFSSVGGRRCVLSFLSSMSKPDMRAAAQGLLAGAHRFMSPSTGLMIVSADRDDAKAAVPDNITSGRFLFDFDHGVAKLYGAVDQDGIHRGLTFIIDERLRILGVVPVRDPAAHAAEVFQAFDRIAEPPKARRADRQAPVLVIPDVFEPAFCKMLIDGHAADGGEESGYMVEKDGRTVEAHDYSHKRRRDWVFADEALQAACRVRVKRRIVPEIQRACQFHATRIERYLVACYESEAGGHFAAHRDNTTKGTAHRRFAVSINLNADYEGGDLVFPEFGRAHFKPPIGGACVFSCSLMHEATPVRAGKRYVFVPFLYDDAAKAIREENAHFLG